MYLSRCSEIDVLKDPESTIGATQCIYFAELTAPRDESVAEAHERKTLS